MKYSTLTKAISAFAGAITGGAMIITGAFVINKETMLTFSKETGEVLAGKCYLVTIAQFDCPPKGPPQYPPPGGVQTEDWTCLPARMTDQCVLTNAETGSGITRPFRQLWELCPPGELWGYDPKARRWDMIRGWNDYADGQRDKTPTPCLHYLNGVGGANCVVE